MSFTTELKELMLKHNVYSIYWTCGECSDTYGIYDEEMIISFNGKGKEDIRIQGNIIELENL